MQRIMKWMMILITAGLLLFNPVGQVGAADGDGDGSGGGQNNPLVVDSSTPTNGATGVINLEYIKIVFSKNVVYMTVRDNNMKCFSLWSGDKKIPAEIIMADDQIEREKRNDVLVKPLQPLQAGATYRVEIAPEVQSKSGVYLGHKESISFTMADKSHTPSTINAGANNPQISVGTETPSNTISPPASSSDLTGAPAIAENKQDATSSTSPEAEQKTGAGFEAGWLLWIAAAAVIVTVAALVYRRSKH